MTSSDLTSSSGRVAYTRRDGVDKYVERLGPSLTLNRSAR
jgi:hypothetical protein